MLATTGIVGSLDLLQTRLNQGRTDNVARYINAAMTSANRAAALTHRLLAFSRRQSLKTISTRRITTIRSPRSIAISVPTTTTLGITNTRACR